MRLSRYPQNGRFYRTCYAVLAFDLPENLARQPFQVKPIFLLAISRCNPRIAVLSALISFKTAYWER